MTSIGCFSATASSDIPSAAQSITDVAATNGVNPSYFARLLRLDYLAPDIVEAIIAGRQPSELTANRLVRMHDVPIDWAGQREHLGFPAV